ncbi:uncharacterized protein LOC124808710 [Hydra vulgaris]|uniref:uncharacterized protein LOC124808710 n=1 Tax=Hydra vulgaris TaxID=6087 RepID=UPI001F5EE541|nr:uncharacterized protein LOC124808710 [Hydra vulgaris]
MKKSAKVSPHDNITEVGIETPTECRFDNNDMNQNEKDNTSINKINHFHIKSIEYRGSFTVHGLSRALTGNVFEKIFWGFIILLSIGIIVRIAWSLIIKYNKNDVYIRFYSNEYTEEETPVLTICPIQVDKRGICKLDNNCTTTSNISQLPYSENSSSIWLNDKISVEAPDSMVEGSQIGDYIESTYYDCVRVNPRFFDTSTYTENSLRIYTIYPQEKIELFVHDAKDLYPFFQTQPDYIEVNESDVISIELKHYNRLERPYASNCSQDSEFLIFPGNYSKIKCTESLKCISSYKVCGGSYDFCEQFIPKAFKAVQANFSQNEAENLTECLLQEYKKKYDRECPLPCYENVYTFLPSFSFNCNWLDNSREIVLFFPISPYYHVFEEVPLYSFEQLLSECGGLIGLFTGSSLISFIEVMAFLSLILLKMFNKNKNKNET